MLLDEKYNHLKITDLGLIKVGIKQPNGSYVFEYTSDRGTRGYMAPEIEKNIENFTSKVDVFGLGRTCWAMIYRPSLYPQEGVVVETLTKQSEVLSKVPVSEEVWKYVKM